MKLLNRTLLGFLLCLMPLVGCGQKGPLYLPEDNPNNEPQKRQKRDTSYF